MGKRNQSKLQWVSLIAMVGQSLLAVVDVGATNAGLLDITVRDATIPTNQRMMEASSFGIEMVDNSIAVLERGFVGMTEVETAHFMRFFDPGTTGDADYQFLQDVLMNFRRIRARVVGQIVVEYESSSIVCTGDMQLYYTDFARIHICPYFLEEDNELRLARDYVHEIAHVALKVLDRPYFFPHYGPYQQLTPRGHWSASIPMVGPIFREMARQDTLYQPDAYAKISESLACLQDDVSEKYRCPPHIAAVSAKLAADQAAVSVDPIDDPSDRRLLSLSNGSHD